MKKIIDQFAVILMNSFRKHPLVEKFFVLQGITCSTQIINRYPIETLADVEFSVFSQWGEDGIIEWLIQRNEDMPETFIEFGVEDFTESNCRLLLMNRNWRGLVMDSSKKNIDIIRADSVSWKYDLTSICQFVTCENINSVIESSDINGEIGFLSVDIDGNDYWVWKSIDCVKPHFVIVEYNAAFGDVEPISIPYRGDFARTKAHSSNLYFGASIAALSHLAAEKGYTLLGSNRAGNNAFFVRNDRLHIFDSLIKNKKARPSRFRESRDSFGDLSFIRGIGRSQCIKDMPVVDVITGKRQVLGKLDSLYSKEWIISMAGK